MVDITAILCILGTHIEDVSLIPTTDDTGHGVVMRACDMLSRAVHMSVWVRYPNFF